MSAALLRLLETGTTRDHLRLFAELVRRWHGLEPRVAVEESADFVPGEGIPGVLRWVYGSYPDLRFLRRQDPLLTPPDLIPIAPRHVLFRHEAQWVEAWACRSDCPDPIVLATNAPGKAKGIDSTWISLGTSLSLFLCQSVVAEGVIDPPHGCFTSKIPHLWFWADFVEA